MLRKLINLRKEEIFRGSIILLIMVNIFNFLNYLFHVSMARLLGPSDYGILAVLMSLVYIFSIQGEGIQTIVSRYTTKFNVKKEYGKIKDLLAKSLKKIIFLGFMLFLIYIPISFFLSYFTEIDVGLIIFTGLLIFAFLLMPITWGIMQGRKKFTSLGGNMILSSLLKLILAVIFVVWGLKVYGAIAGVILSHLTVLLFSFYFIREITTTKIEKTKITGVYSYGLPVMIVMLSIILMASLDIILVKVFFSAELAGKYAVASMLGKMIFFGTSAIGKAMFPITSEGHDKGDKTKNLFKRAFVLVILLCAAAVLVFGLFPKLVIGILFGSQYLEVASILVFIALAFSFISLSNVSLLYSLSVHKRNLYFFIVFVFLEVVILSVFNSSILEFSIAFMTINFIMFIVSLLFTIRE